MPKRGRAQLFVSQGYRRTRSHTRARRARDLIPVTHDMLVVASIQELLATLRYL